MSEEPLILAIPSKGRLMEDASTLFADAGMLIEKTGHDRGYRGVINGFEGVTVAFLSASEIATQLQLGLVHMGITGEDLVREQIPNANEVVEFVGPLGFGHANVIVAVPDCWIDVHVIAQIEDIGAVFHRNHGRRLRVATKYMNITRKFFAEHGVTGYRIVESLGATEGTPAAGTAELIVDITSTGSTLKANHLKILDDGIILESEANLLASKTAEWSATANEARAAILERLAE